MRQIEFIYDADCPNVEAARKQLAIALEAAGEKTECREWLRADPEAPAYVLHYGSPTILVDGEDAAGAQPSADAGCCRVYRDDEGGLSGVPSIRMLCKALRGPCRLP